MLKSIDKDPGRRYQTAEDMAEDLRRFLADEPIQARRVSPWQRAALWARRRPAEAALVAVGSLDAYVHRAFIGRVGIAKRRRSAGSRLKIARPWRTSSGVAAWSSGSKVRAV